MVFRCNILINKQLTVWQLSANCLDGLLMKGLIVECVQDCIADTLTYNYQMRGILTTRMACVGRILKTGIWVLQHQLIGHLSDCKSAHPGQAACPCGASSVPMLGKHVTPSGHGYCPECAQNIHVMKALERNAMATWSDDTSMILL